MDASGMDIIDAFALNDRKQTSVSGMKSSMVISSETSVTEGGYTNLVGKFWLCGSVRYEIQRK